MELNKSINYSYLTNMDPSFTTLLSGLVTSNTWITAYNECREFWGQARLLKVTHGVFHVSQKSHAVITWGEDFRGRHLVFKYLWYKECPTDLMPLSEKMDGDHARKDHNNVERKVWQEFQALIAAHEAMSLMPKC